MASLLEHVMINKLSDELNEAITAVGGDTSCASGPMDYPDIIRDQLSANGFDGNNNLEEGTGVVIEKVDGGWKVSANSGATLIRPLKAPHNIDNDANEDFIDAGESIQLAFEKILGDILPTLPSVLQGDIIKSSIDGTDQYQNPNFPTLATKSGLVPETYYIRIFLASQQEPIYISCSPLGAIGGTALEYEGVDTDTVKMNIKDGKISAEVIGLSAGIIKRENMSEQLLIELQPIGLDDSEAEELFNDIFNS